MYTALWRLGIRVRAFNHKVECIALAGDSKSQRKSILHDWFKSYGNFAGHVDFFYWWSYIGKCLRLMNFAGHVDFAYWWSCIGTDLRSMGLSRLVYPQLSLKIPELKYVMNWKKSSISILV